MPDESSDYRHRRRTFLKSVGALGATAATTTSAAAETASDSLDDYHRTLRADLTASSRQQRQLPPGTYVYGTTEEAALDAFSLAGDGTATRITVDTDAVPITRAERLDVPGGASDPAAAAYRGELTDHDVSEGDLLLAVAYLRSDSANAEAHAAFGYGDGENFVQRGAHAEPTAEWMRYYFPIEVGATPASQSAAFELRVGYGDQTVDVGGVALLDYSDADVSLGTLPPYDYDGRDPDAAWRDAAHARIEETRKTDVEVEVLNPGGQPLQGANVEVEMVEHEFDFGSAVSVDHITGDSADDETYRETFLDNFNKAVLENGMKYPAWEGDWGIDNDATRATLDWLNERDIPTRGHYLLWEQAGGSGGGGMSIENADQLSADELQARVTEKITDHVAEFEDDVTEWDMHNHPIWQSNFRDDPALGWDAVRAWWDAAADATDDELYTNEMGVVGGAWQRSQYYDFITHLATNDYPLGGIGFMGHHQQKWNQLLDVQDMLAGFRQFADFDAPILVTEFDVQIFSRRNAQEVELQRDYLRDFLTVAFSTPAVEGVVSWGFWANDHWRPTGAYYDADWTLRPHGEQFRDLVFDEWWTEDAGETDDDGVYATRGFKGTYEIRAEKGALAGETTVDVSDDTDTVTVELTPPGKSKPKSKGKGKDKGNGT